MSSTLSVTKTLSNDGWTVIATLEMGATIPRDIFAYENTGTTTLGPYAAVINVKDLERMQIWLGSSIPNFGNKFVRLDTATFLVPIGADPDQAISRLIESVQKFSTAYQDSGNSTTTYTIT